ncbi:MAG TPA: VCBS repeat-containing protein [Verrucomicrobiae bacterium]|nr:VCBS repeat-containing protein [Verrucomicrobiae bacterium]
MHRLTLAAAGLGVLLVPWGDASAAKPLFPLHQFTTLESAYAVTADFDGDGRLDLAFTTSQGSVVTLHGQGDGSFSSQTTLGIGGGQTSTFVAGDFNGDGRIDLATGGPKVFPGHGDGTFGAAIPTAVPALRDLVAGDVNGDGITDLVTSDATGCRALLGTASGVFAPQGYAFTFNSVQKVAAGDFNGDGHLDVAFTWQSSANNYVLSFRLGTGTGSFSSFTGQTDYFGVPQIGVLASADFDGDGRGDLATGYADSNGAQLLIYFSDPGGNSTAGPYSTGGTMSVANLDADGLPDLLLAGSTVDFVTHTAPRAFSVLHTGSVRAQNNHVLADFDSDGRLDLLSPQERTIFPGQSDGTFAIPRIRTNAVIQFDLAIGDLDADGRPDIVVGDNAPDGISVLLGQGQGRFGLLTPLPAHGRPSGLAVCDIDGDGHQDAAASTAGSDPALVSVYYGAGDGTLAPSMDLDTQLAYPQLRACADLNHDGRDDLVVAEFVADTASVILGHADRVVGPEVRYPGVDGPRAAALGDFNEDGEKDLIVGGVGGLVFRSGHGDGTFGSQVILETTPEVQSIAVADLDQDGHLDLAVAGPGALAVLFGRGDGAFLPRRTVDSGTGVAFTSVVAADLDRDGWSDLFVSISTSGYYGSFQHNNHDRTFGPSSRYSLGSDSYKVAVADFDADGNPDVAAAATYSNVEILLNQTVVDSDGDGVFDGADCAPANAGVFAAPMEVAGLVCAANDVSWNSQAASAGAATLYDVVRGDLPMSGAPAPQCLADGLAQATWNDPAAPAIGTGYWYQVRAGNACGVGGYGNASNGTPRNIGACP